MSDNAGPSLFTATERFAAAEAARAAGIPLVGIVGATVPIELIFAAGAYPLPLTGRAQDWSRVSELIEIENEPEVKSLFLQALDGDFNICDFMVIATTSDGNRCLFQYLQEIGRQGVVSDLPSITQFDLLLGRGEEIRRYSRTALEQLELRVSALTGNAIREGVLRSQLLRSNEIRALQRRLSHLRYAGCVTGVQAMQALSAAKYTEPDAYKTQLADALTCADAKTHIGRPRVLVISAAPLYHLELHELIESCGALVVVEDDEWGPRRAAVDFDMTEAPREALFSWYYNHSYSPRMPTEQREKWLLETMGSELDGVVFYIPPSDQFFGWRYPELHRRSLESDLPSVLLRGEVLDLQDRAPMARALEDFVSQLNRNRR
jgi:benzoyl-CoA reductase/2-hydroxyglutaryl-CoA dehydratase subunit BcrC/BadD/HgdB